MSILSRYILRELLLNSFLFLTIFLTLFTLVLGTINLRDFIGLNPDFNIILKIYGLTMLQLLSLIIPLSTFFGILMTFYRLREDKEMLAFFTLGFTLKDLIFPLFFFTLLVFILTHLSQFYLLPSSKRQQKLVLLDLKKNISQKFFPVKKPVNLTDNMYIYVRSVETDNDLQTVSGLLILERGPGGRRVIYQAEQARLNLKEGLLYLSNGKILSFNLDKLFEIIFFTSYTIKLNEGSLFQEKVYFKRGEMTIEELKKAINEAKEKNLKQYLRLLSEYYHRYLYAISITQLLIHAFFLSLCLRIHHRFLFFIFGLLFYTSFYYIYNFLLSMAEKGNLDPLIALSLFSLLSLCVLSVELFITFRRGLGFTI